jgi:hypothetical protein
MLVSTAAAGRKQTAVPVRAFNVFFGLGIPAPLQTEGFDGVLEPLKPLGDKLLILRQVDQVRCDLPGINAHYDGSTAAFTAEPPNGTARAGGPSIDQVVRAAHYPDGCRPAWCPPSSPARSSAATAWSATSTASTPTAPSPRRCRRKPRDLFERIFGTIDRTTPSDPTSAASGCAAASSIRSWSSRSSTPADNSPLGAASKARLADHLDRIREYEQRAFEMAEEAAAQRQARTRRRLEDRPRRRSRPRRRGDRHHARRAHAEWRLMADLYALAIQCDRVRFGSITFLAAGERIRLKGKYEYDGRTVFQFDDGGQRKSGGGQRMQPRVVARLQREEEERAAPRPRPHEDARGGLLPERLDDAESRKPTARRSSRTR